MKQAIIFIIAVLLGSTIYAQTADWIWAKEAGGTSSDDGKSIATDSSGNSYVTGYFPGTATFGTISLTSSGYEDFFIAKLDSSGNYQWVQQASNTEWSNGYGIATDSSGNIYVTGFFRGTATFGMTSLTSSGGSDIFIAKLDPSGNFLWAKDAWGTDSAYVKGYAIATDSSGNSYVTGIFTGIATFGSTSLLCSSISPTSPDIFISKLDPNGNFLWAKQAGCIVDDYGYGIATDSSGNSYVTGYFFDTATFGTTALTSSGSEDIFITKLDTNGNFLWAKKAGGWRSDYGYGIATDSSGNSYVTGVFQNTATFGTTSLTSSGNEDFFIAKLDPDGNFLWAKKAGGTSYDNGYGIATDSSGNSYVTGSFNGTATFGTSSLTSSGGSDIFIAKLDPSGNFLWAKKDGGTSSGYGRGISIDSSGNSYVTGFFIGTATFGTTSLTSSGVEDIFIAKLSSDGVFVSDELISPAASVSHLGNAYPNPFRAGASGTIKADVPALETGLFTIYNLRGQVLQSHCLSAGAHELSVSATDLAPGIYFYRLETPSLCEVKKLVVLR